MGSSFPRKLKHRYSRAIRSPLFVRCFVACVALQVLMFVCIDMEIVALSSLAETCVYHMYQPFVFLFRVVAEVPEGIGQGLRVLPVIAIALLLYSFIAASVLAVTLPPALFRRDTTRRCESCGYDLRGLDIRTVCPECGKHSE